MLPLHNLVWDGTTAAPSATVTDTRQYVKDQLNMLRQVRRTEKERETERQTEKERETERETEKERETETETERQRQRQRETTAVSVTGLYL